MPKRVTPIPAPVVTMPVLTGKTEAERRVIAKWQRIAWRVAGEEAS